MRLTAVIISLILTFAASASARTVSVSKKPQPRALHSKVKASRNHSARSGGKVRRTHAAVRGRRGRYRRVIFEATPLKGSRESILRQNERTAGDDLERLRTEDDLLDAIDRKDLVELTNNESMMATSIPADRRYCRPWTLTFVQDLADEYHKQFGAPLMVTSAVRTEQVQRKIRRRNHNAADVDGELASPHLTGATIDIGKSGMGKQQRAWMRDYLFKIQDAGQIDVIEEFRTHCFHITVYRDYELARLEQPGMLAAPVDVNPTSVVPGPVATPIVPRAAAPLTNEDLEQRFHGATRLAE